MSGLQSILLASDLSAQAERAGRRAARLADEAGARLAAVHVIEGELPQVPLPEGADPAAHLEAAVRERLQAGTPGREAALHVRFGSPVAGISEVAEAEGAELVVVGAHGRQHWADWLVGTTADQLVRHHQAPTLVVRSEPSGPYGRVLVATDFSACARAALQRVADWFPGAEVSLLHAIDTQLLEQMREAGVEERWLERRYEDWREQAEAQLREEARVCGLDPERVGLELRSGYPAEAVAEAARTLAPELLVMGNHGRGRWRDIVLGSVAARALQQSGADLLLVREGPQPIRG